VSVREADEVAIERPTDEAEIQRLDTRRPVDVRPSLRFLRLTSPSNAEIDVRVALIEYELPPEGESQQWIRVTELAPLTTLAARPSCFRAPRAWRWYGFSFGSDVRSGGRRHA
jgi:hypothetical protein